MTESRRHKTWKDAACGCGAETEFTFGKGKRLDCINPTASRCAEVELNRRRIPYDLRKLQAAKSAGICASPRLVVKPKDYRLATQLARPKGVEVVAATNWNLTVARACSPFDYRRKLRLL